MSKFFAFLCLLLFSLSSYSQVNLGLNQRLIPLHESNKLPSQILETIGSNLNVSVSYNADYLKNEIVTISSDTLTLKEIVDSLFIPKDLKLRLIGNQLVIFEPAEEPIVLDTCNHVISGKIIDNFTKQFLSRVTIKEIQTDQLTVSNRDGAFLLKLPCGLEFMQLEITAIGYRSRFIHQPIQEKMEPIYLEGDYIALKDVYILSVQADKLMKEVLENVNQYYINKPTTSTSFFREAVLKNNKLVAISEGVFNVYNQPYVSPHKLDQVQLIKGRKFVDHQNIDTVDFKIKGSLRSCFELDIVKQQPFFFNEETYLDMYEYNFNTVKELNGRDIYVISFKHKPNAQGLPYEGKMYIDKELKTLVSIEFELNKNSLKAAEDYLVVKKSRNIKTKLLDVNYVVQYTDIDGKLAMNYVFFKSNFKVRKKKSMFSARYETITEYVVNKFELEDVDKIRLRDSFSSDKIFMDEPLTYTDSYWDGINFLPLDKPLLESSEELQKIFSKNQ